MRSLYDFPIVKNEQETTAQIIASIQSGRVFDSNEGVLTEMISGKVTQTEDDYYADITYPVSALTAKAIRLDRLLVIVDQSWDSNPQLKAQIFRITTIECSLYEMKVHAEHISRDLETHVVLPFEPVQGSIAARNMILNNLVRNGSDSLPLQIFSNSGNTSSNFGFAEPRTAMEALRGKEGSYLDVFGGQVRFDNLNVCFEDPNYNPSGIVRNGVNMENFRSRLTRDGWYTSVLGYVTRDGEMSIFGSVLSWTNAYTTPRTKLVDFSDRFEDGEVEEAITEGNVAAVVSKIDRLSREHMDRQQWDQHGSSISVGLVSGCYGLHDCVLVPDPLADGFYATSVVSRTYDLMLKRNIKYEFGEPQKSAAKRIAAAINNRRR